MIRFLIKTKLLMVLLLQTPQLPPSPLPLPQPLLPPMVCDGTENPCDVTKPWVRGSIEKSCGRVSQVEEMRKQAPDKIILECKCQHRCNPADPNAEATINRSWDGRCQARCNPRNCKCPTPCDT